MAQKKQKTVTSERPGLLQRLSNWFGQNPASEDIYPTDGTYNSLVGDGAESNDALAELAGQVQNLTLGEMPIVQNPPESKKKIAPTAVRPKTKLAIVDTELPKDGRPEIRIRDDEPTHDIASAGSDASNETQVLPAVENDRYILQVKDDSVPEPSVNQGSSIWSSSNNKSNSLGAMAERVMKASDTKVYDKTRALLNSNLYLHFNPPELGAVSCRDIKSENRFELIVSNEFDLMRLYIIGFTKAEAEELHREPGPDKWLVNPEYAMERMTARNIDSQDKLLGQIQSQSGFHDITVKRTDWNGDPLVINRIEVGTKSNEVLGVENVDKCPAIKVIKQQVISIPRDALEEKLRGIPDPQTVIELD